MDTQKLGTGNADIAAAASLLSQGALVAFPTETVYGLGADARNSQAVARIFEAKGRPRFNPLIVHLAEASQAQSLAQWSEQAARLAERFWPGPLSLVLPLNPGHGLSPLVTAGLPSVALRVPAHPAAQALLAAFGGALAAPSANPSGRISPTRAAHVVAGLEGRVAAVVDGGTCDLGLESTILDLTGADPILLREGGVPRETLQDTLGLELVQTRGAPAQITAPGQLSSHYAPRGALRMNATTAEAGERLLGFGPIKGDLNLSAKGDLAEAAARLFDLLHQMDQTNAPIAVAPIPEIGLGRAINDRLRRAAAPRKTAG